MLVIMPIYALKIWELRIYGIMDDGKGRGCTNSEQLVYYKASGGLNKPGSYDDNSPTFNEVVSEINRCRPLKSGIPGHARACRGYTSTVYGLKYLSINDPYPGILGGRQCLEIWGSEDDHIYVGGNSSQFFTR